MIVVHLELWPGGDESRAQDLGTAVIANVSDLADDSAYGVCLKKGARYSSDPGSTWRTGRVERFPRRSTQFGPWELLYLALEATLGERIARLRRYLSAPVVEYVEKTREQTSRNVEEHS